MELEHLGGRRLATLSGGTKRRVDLAASLMHLPPILFLDEPTQGMDPRSRAGFWDTLEHLRRHLAEALQRAGCADSGCVHCGSTPSVWTRPEDGDATDRRRNDRRHRPTRELTRDPLLRRDGTDDVLRALRKARLLH